MSNTITQKYMFNWLNKEKLPQPLLNVLTIYRFKALQDMQMSSEEGLFYRKKFLSTEIPRKCLDSVIQKSLCISNQERDHIIQQVSMLVLSNDKEKLKNSNELITKYCMLFSSHEELLDDWCRIWQYRHRQIISNQSLKTGSVCRIEEPN